jgi:hypothetical protein
MFCESYRKAMSEAVLLGGRVHWETAAHLAVCAGCQSALANERELIGSIDAALRTKVNLETPPSLLARVRQAASAERRPRKVVYVRALLWPVAVCVVALFVARLHIQGPAPVPPPAVLPANAGLPTVAFGSTNTPTIEPHYRNVLRREREGSQPRTEDERSIGKLLKLARKQPDVVASFVKSSPTDNPIEIQPIEVAELDWKPVVIMPAEEGRSEPNR